jgi:hypothetical protein
MRYKPMTTGWIREIRSAVAEAMQECIATKALCKEYCVLWWVGREVRPLHCVVGAKP